MGSRGLERPFTCLYLLSASPVIDIEKDMGGRMKRSLL